MELIYDESSIQIVFDNTLYFTIELDEAQRPTNYQYVFRIDTTIKYDNPIDNDYYHLFDVPLSYAMESFEPNEYLTELWKDYSLSNKQIGEYSIMILVGLVLGIHVLFSDDEVASILGHDYMVHECMLSQVTKDRILRMLPLFMCMHRIGTEVESQYGNVGYELGLLFLECFKEETDVDLTGYNATISMMTYQNILRLQEEKEDEKENFVKMLEEEKTKLEEKLQKNLEKVDEKLENLQKIETPKIYEVKSYDNEILEIKNSLQEYVRLEDISQRLNSLEVKLKTSESDKKKLESENKKLKEGFLVLVEKQEELEKLVEKMGRFFEKYNQR